MQYPRRKTDLVLDAYSDRNSEHGGGVGVGGGGGGGREDLDCQSWWWSRRLRRPSVPNVRRVSGEVYSDGQGFHMDIMLERPTFPLVSFSSPTFWFTFQNIIYLYYSKLSIVIIIIFICDNIVVRSIIVYSIDWVQVSWHLFSSFVLSVPPPFE